MEESGVPHGKKLADAPNHFTVGAVHKIRRRRDHSTQRSSSNTGTGCKGIPRTCFSHSAAVLALCVLSIVEIVSVNHSCGSRFNRKEPNGLGGVLSGGLRLYEGVLSRKDAEGGVRSRNEVEASYKWLTPIMPVMTRILPLFM